jgi:hypothetical protein
MNPGKSGDFVMDGMPVLQRRIFVAMLLLVRISRGGKE